MVKVSVIMGVYNGAEKVNKAINSILKQSFSDFELIICDDGSTDNSVKIIEKLADRDERIILIKNHNNMGLAKALNRCLNVAKGKYIARMDDDDISHINRFNIQVAFLDSHPEYALVGTSRNMYDDIGVWGKAVVKGEPSKLDIYLGRTFVHPSVMIRSNAINNVGGYTTSPNVGRTEDFDLWCKLYLKGYKGFNLSDILLDYYEARDSYKKRKYKYRVSEYKLKIHWRRKLGIQHKYAIYAFRPLLVGLLPTSILMKYHEKKFSK